MKNSEDLGGCSPPRPSASVDNTLLDQQNSSYPTQPHSTFANYELLMFVSTGTPGKARHIKIDSNKNN